jgi:2-phospho-L-lactate/phosphoenolpyruvate guanylyltransferase
MSLWAIIPVKPLKNAKSRLSPVLTPDQRYEFAQAMFRHVLSVVTTVSYITGVVVISRDTKALSIAREMGAKTIQEGTVSDLNPALLRATAVVRSWRADGVLILPADLPFINVDDIKSMVRLSNQDIPSIVIATDDEGDGTNALLVRPPGVIEYSYGRGSFQQHIENAHQARANVISYYSDRLALDIDVPEDLRTYHKILTQGRFGHLPVFPQQDTNMLEALE